MKSSGSAMNQRHWYWLSFRLILLLQDNDLSFTELLEGLRSKQMIGSVDGRFVTL
jgi:hypothetical protein